MWSQLAVLALLLAVIPASIVWASKDQNKYRKLIWVTTFITFDLIIFGAFTRLSDSGLGCPDWPGCYGHATPAQAMAQINAEAAALPSGPVTPAKAWIEMIHRYLAMMVGVLIIAITIFAWKQRNAMKQSAWFAFFILGLVCLQGAFGAWTVTMKLQPSIVTTHLLLGNFLLLCLAWLGTRQAPNIAQSAAIMIAPRIKMAAVIGLVLLFTQIALGGWVSTNYAALACPDFPLCRGSIMPEQMDMAKGFEIWRPLGITKSGEFLPANALIAIHWVHRMFALVVVTYLATLAFKIRKTPALSALPYLLLGLIGFQVLTGITTVFFEWPLAIALMHSGGAAALVLTMTLIAARLFSPAE